MADTHVKHHDYHLVNPSPWPLLASVAALITAIGGIAWMRTHVDGEGVLGIKG
ncbi:MAG: cytochrome c oxidase subunit 3, partial [Hyphomicrobium denitrificans]|nr:cytochrome c oxidase subunit 3 [Hyphomicrobium denitrificans]